MGSLWSMSGTIGGVLGLLEASWGLLAMGSLSRSGLYGCELLYIVFRSVLGPFWGASGDFWGSLGASWNHLWRLLAPAWGGLGALLGGLGGLDESACARCRLARTRTHFGSFWMLPFAVRVGAHACACRRTDAAETGARRHAHTSGRLGRGGDGIFIDLSLRL